MPYRFIDHTADIAVEVEAASMEDLFALACHAWRDAALESCDTCSTDSRFITLSANNYEELLITLLNELNYLLYSGRWSFNSVGSIELNKFADGVTVNAEVLGEDYNSETERIKVEIKAVTYHDIRIEEHEGRFGTRIVFDI